MTDVMVNSDELEKLRFAAARSDYLLPLVFAMINHKNIKGMSDENLLIYYKRGLNAVADSDQDFLAASYHGIGLPARTIGALFTLAGKV